MFDHFQHIRIVNLPQRGDRRRDMRRQLDKLGLRGDQRVVFFNAVQKNDPGPFLRVGSHGAFLSHLALLREAAGAQGATLILQDDCNFLPAAVGYRVPDCDIFYGGWEWVSDTGDLTGSEVVGAHCMGFSPRAASLAVTYLDAFYSDPDFRPDPKAAAVDGYNPAIRPPIDGAIVWFRRAHPELTTVFADLARQRASATDIGHRQWFDRVPLIRNLATWTRGLKRFF